MIAYVRGTLVEKEPTYAVIEAAGVGYELLISLNAYEELPKVGSEAKLLTYHSIREDDEALFGFASQDERELFMKLIGVSGVGPKTALSILSDSSMHELSLAISSGNAKRIAAIKGVGKKTAEKIIIELRDKVKIVSGGKSGGGVSPAVRDAVLALSALGFSEEAANETIAKILEKDPGLDDTEALIRLALKAK